MKLLISAFIGSENLGDRAIFKSILDNLGVRKSQVTAVTINEEDTRKYGVKTVFANNPFNIVRAIKECDVFLMGGGGIIQDQSSLLNFLYYTFQLAVAKHYKKPTILLFVGIGPIKYKISWFILRRVASHVDLAVVRDESSKQLFYRATDNPDRIIAAHDAVFSFIFDRHKLPPSQFAEKSPYVAVSLRRWFFTNPLLPVFITRKLNRLPIFRIKYDAFVAQIARDLDAFLERHCDMTLVLMSLYDREDIEVFRDVRRHMQCKKRTVGAKKGLTETECLSILRQARFLLGMRLHSLVLASIVGKPFVALRYSTKVDELTEQLGLTEYSIDIEHYESVKLQAVLSAMVKNAPKMEKRIQNTVEEFHKTTEDAFESVKKRLAVLKKQTKSR